MHANANFVSRPTRPQALSGELDIKSNWMLLTMDVNFEILLSLLVSTRKLIEVEE